MKDYGAEKVAREAVYGLIFAIRDITKKLTKSSLKNIRENEREKITKNDIEHAIKAFQSN